MCFRKKVHQVECCLDASVIFLILCWFTCHNIWFAFLIPSEAVWHGYCPHMVPEIAVLEASKAPCTTGAMIRHYLCQRSVWGYCWFSHYLLLRHLSANAGKWPCLWTWPWVSLFMTTYCFCPLLAVDLFSPFWFGILFLFIITWNNRILWLFELASVFFK